MGPVTIAAGPTTTTLAGLAPPYLADNDCHLISLTDRHLRSADIRTRVVP